MLSSNSVFAILVRVVVSVLIIAAGFGGFLVLGQKKPPPSRTSKEKFPPVKTVQVQRHTNGLDIEVDGVVVPYREITLAAEVSGKIIKKNPLCRAGKFVTKNMKLMTIDPRDYELQELQLKAELEQAGDMLEETIVELANAAKVTKLADRQLGLQKDNLTRVLQLFSQNAASPTEVDTARQSELKAQNELQTLKNQSRLLNARKVRLRTAKKIVAAKLQKAELDLQRTKIESPLDGIVVECKIEQGDHVQNGAVLVTIEDASALEVKCNLRMKELAWLWRQSTPLGEKINDGNIKSRFPSAAAEVIYRIGNRELVWRGELSRFDGAGLDPKTRTVPCRIKVDQPRKFEVRGQKTEVRGQKTEVRGQRTAGPQALMRGMFVTVRILAKPQTPLLRFSERAFRPGNVVWRFEGLRIVPAKKGESQTEEGELKIVPVTVARISNGQVIVRADNTELSAGDQIVVSHLDYPIDGLKVQKKKKKK